MKASKTAPGLLVAMIAIIALPGAAQAEYLVPPGNSAATQYTEAVPTAGGPKASNNSKHGKAKTPKQVLGNDNVAKLHAQGAEGRAVAEVAAETAPGDVSNTRQSATTTPSRGSSPSGGDGGSHGGSSGANGGGPSAAGGSDGAHGTTNVVDTTLASEQIPNGSSGFGEVLGQATGASSSGQLGLLLPLIVLGAIAWSVAFVLRRRRQPTH